MQLAPKRLPWLLLISALVVFADQWTKRWIAATIPLGRSIPVVPHVFWLSHWTNDGAAFSLFAGSASPLLVRWGLVGFSLLASLIVLVLLIRFSERFTLTTLSLALILAGALGNAHDRILFGSVVDFLEVHIFGYHWPDFNVADSAVVTGACLLLLDTLLAKHDDPEQEEA